MTIPIKTIIAWGTIATGTITGGYEGVKTLAPYFYNPPPFANEKQVAQTLQQVQKGLALTNKRLDDKDRHDRQTDLDINAFKLSAKGSEVDSLNLEVRLHPGDPNLRRLLKNSTQELADLQAEHDRLRSTK